MTGRFVQSALPLTDGHFVRPENWDVVSVDSEITIPVVFRRMLGDGNVIALLPTTLYDQSPFYCVAYEVPGKPAKADPYFIEARSRPASQPAYAAMLESLRQIHKNKVLTAHVRISLPMHAWRLHKAYALANRIVDRRSVIHPVSTFHSCVCCGAETNGKYVNISICMDCYQNGRLLVWLAEHPDALDAS